MDTIPLHKYFQYLYTTNPANVIRQKLNSLTYVSRSMYGTKYRKVHMNEHNPTTTTIVLPLATFRPIEPTNPSAKRPRRILWWH